MAPHGSTSSQGADRVYPQPFGRYRLVAPIAMGGMAEVFLAEMLGPLGFRRRVAIKRILPHLAENKEFVRAFVDEARVGGLLVHPNIVQILDFDFVDEIPYLAMEYVDGGHFGQILNRARRRGTYLPASCIAALFVQVGRGIEWAHQAHDVDGTPLNLIHRDLKPSNMLLGFDGQVKVADFGIAKASSNLTQTMPYMVKGSVPYMSPEQANGDEPLTQSSDLFAIGAVLYEFLTLERLYQPLTSAMGLLAMVARGPSARSLALLQELPDQAAPLAAIVARLLAVAPAERYPDAAAFVAALENAGIPMASQDELAAFASRWLSEEEATTSRQILLPPGGEVRSLKRGMDGDDSDPPAPARPEKARPATLEKHNPDEAETPPDGLPSGTEVTQQSTEVSPERAVATPSGADEREKRRDGADEPRVSRPSGRTPSPPGGLPGDARRDLEAGDDPTTGRKTQSFDPLALAIAIALLLVVLLASWMALRQTHHPPVTSVTDTEARAWLYVVADLPDATILVDGEALGPPPRQFGLRDLSSPIRVRLEAPGREPVEWSGTIDPSEHRVLDFGTGESPRTWTFSKAPWEPVPGSSGIPVPASNNSKPG